MLILLPAIAGGHISNGSVLVILLSGIALFSLLASSGYVFNDLLDFKTDQQHPRKKRRSIASGSVSRRIAKVTGGSCAIIALGFSLFLSIEFSLVLIVYLILSLLYSSVLKKLLAIDILVLVSLYILRIIAGFSLSPAGPTTWLFLFIFFLFLSLAVLKRYSELLLLASLELNIVSGRAYQKSHSKVLQGVGVGAALTAAVILFIYTTSDAVTLIYSNPIWFLGFPIALLYWMATAWITARKNKMDCDPIIYALRHYSTYVCAVVCIPCFLLAQ